MVAITAAPVAVVRASLRVAGAGTNARERRRQQAAAARRHTAAKRAMLGDLFWLGEAVTKNASDRSKKGASASNAACLRNCLRDSTKLKKLTTACTGTTSVCMPTPSGNLSSRRLNAHGSRMSLPSTDQAVNAQ